MIAELAAHGVAQEGFRGGWLGNCHLPSGGHFPSLGVMRRIWQATAAMVCAVSTVGAAEEPSKSFPWDAPKVTTSLFSPNLGMMNSERDEYATNLATLAANHVAAAKASPASLADARKMLVLALQLSPRNRRAVVVNFQLAKGVVPEATESTYSQSVLARLLLTRGQLLEKQAGAENVKLARYFIQLAAEMDPKNEDAVYASEVQRLDQGAVDWSELAKGEEKPDQAP
jgi:hypothetical protein